MPGPRDLQATFHTGVVRWDAGDRYRTRSQHRHVFFAGLRSSWRCIRKRYWEEDIIEPEVEVTSKGTIVVPTTPGLGYSVRRKRIEQLTVRQQVFDARAARVSVEGAV